MGRPPTLPYALSPFPRTGAHYTPCRPRPSTALLTSVSAADFKPSAFRSSSPALRRPEIPAGETESLRRGTQTLVQGSSNPRTGEIAYPRRGDRPSPQGQQCWLPIWLAAPFRPDWTPIRKSYFLPFSAALENGIWPIRNHNNNIIYQYISMLLSYFLIFRPPSENREMGFRNYVSVQVKYAGFQD